MTKYSPQSQDFVKLPQAGSISAFSWFLIVTVPAMWSVNYLIGRSAVSLIAPHALALSRWALATFILGVFALPELKAKRKLIWQEGWKHFVLGAFAMWICGAWLYIGARTSPTNNMALIYTLSPVFIVLGAALFLHEKLQTRQWFGIGFALIGLVHVVIQGHWQLLLQIKFVTGDLWVLACAIAWAAYSLLLKKWSSSFSPIARLVLISTSGTLLLLPLSVCEAWTGLYFLPVASSTWSGQTFALIATAAVIPSAGAYLAYSTLQKNIGAARTGLVLYLSPLYAAGLAWFVLGEPLHTYHAIGAVIIFLGIFLASQVKSKNN